MGFRKILNQSFIQFLNVLPNEYSEKVVNLLHETLSERRKQFQPHYDINVPEGSLRISNFGLGFRVKHNWIKKWTEEETIRWIQDYIEPNEKLFDIGASFGLYSLYAARCRKIRVRSFEPEREAYQNLIANINLNDCVSLISPYNIALAHKSRFGALYVGYPQPYSQTFIPEEENVPHTAKLLHPIISITLDDFCRLFQLSPPDHIKLDVDGLELEILQGARKTLPMIRTLMIEVEGDLEKNIKRDLLPLLRDVGLEEAPIVGPQSGRNRLFINKSRKK